MDENDQRAISVKELMKDGPLVFAPDQSGGLLFDALPDGDGHRWSLRPVSITQQHGSGLA